MTTCHTCLEEIPTGARRHQIIILSDSPTDSGLANNTVHCHECTKKVVRALNPDLSAFRDETKRMILEREERALWPDCPACNGRGHRSRGNCSVCGGLGKKSPENT